MQILYSALSVDDRKKLRCESQSCLSYFTERQSITEGELIKLGGLDMLSTILPGISGLTDSLRDKIIDSFKKFHSQSLTLLKIYLIWNPRSNKK